MPLSLSIIIYLYPTHKYLHTFTYWSVSNSFAVSQRFCRIFPTPLLTVRVGISQAMHRVSPSPEINSVTSVNCYWFVSLCMRWSPTPNGGEKWFHVYRMYGKQEKTCLLPSKDIVKHVACKVFKCINCWHEDYCGVRVGGFFLFPLAMISPLQPPSASFVYHISLMGWLSCAYNITELHLCRSEFLMIYKWHFYRGTVIYQYLFQSGIICCCTLAR